MFNISSIFKFLISNLETFKSKYSITITFGENLLRSIPLRTSSSCPSKSIERRSKLLSLYLLFRIILFKVWVLIFLIDETLAFWNLLVLSSNVFKGDLW